MIKYRYIFLPLLLISVLPVLGGQIKLQQIIPESNSEISTFDFTFVFDLSAALEEIDNTIEWGIGVSGAEPIEEDIPPFSTLRTILYEGDPEGEHRELASVLTEYYTGKSSGFIIHNNTLEVNFPKTLKPEPGKRYYLQIGNIFFLCSKGSNDVLGNSLINYSVAPNTPVISKYVGRNPDSNELVLVSSSLDTEAGINELKSVSYTFNTEIAIREGAKVIIKDGGQTLAESTGAVLSEDKKTITLDFALPVKLYNKCNYEVVLTAGSVSLTTDTSQTNKSISQFVKGASAEMLTVTATSPANESTGIYNSASIKWDLPEGLTLAPQKQFMPTCIINVYKDKVSEETFVKKIFGTPTSDGKGFEWSLLSFHYIPSSTYYLVLESDNISIFDENDNEVNNYINDTVEIKFNTPAIKDAGIPLFEFENPVIGDYGSETAKPFTDGMTLDNLYVIDMALKGHRYDMNGKKYDIQISKDAKGYIYQISGDNETLVSEFSISIIGRENSREIFKVAELLVRATFYEGETYRIVIPEGSYYIDCSNLKYYLQSPEVSLTVKGSRPKTLVPTKCTLQDGGEVENIYTMGWTINTPVKFATDSECAKVTYVQNKLTLDEDFPVAITFKNGSSYVKVDCTSKNCLPLAIPSETEAVITLPAGLLCNIGSEDIFNEEISVKVIGKKPEDEKDDEPELVSLSVTINGIHSTKMDALKGITATINLTSDDNWKVKSLERNGIDVMEDFDASTGVYVTPKLQKNTKITAAVEYDGLIINDNPLSEVEIESEKIKVFSDGEFIFIDGISKGDKIAIYTTTGLTVAQKTIEDDDLHSISFKVRRDEIYIVRVNNTAAKIKH